MSSAVAESPLASRHAALGARMIPFAGWNLPVEYSGLLSEHKATRQAAGLFDISHMGQIHALGAGALHAFPTGPNPKGWVPHRARLLAFLRRRPRL